MRTSFSSQCQCTHMALAAVFSSMMISAHALPLGDLAPLNGGLARNELMESSFRETAFHEGRRSRSLPMDPDTLDSVLQDLSHLSSSPTSVLQHDVTIPSVAALVESTSSVDSITTPHSNVPCPIADALLGEHAWILRAFPIITLVLLSFSLVTLVGFVTFFIINRCRFRREYLTPIRMEAPRNKKNLSILVSKVDTKSQHDAPLSSSSFLPLRSSTPTPIPTPTQKHLTAASIPIPRPISPVPTLSPVPPYSPRSPSYASFALPSSSSREAGSLKSKGSFLTLKPE
ncbi:hypothetical protein C8Q76DRAFT_175929 [Earliella scabrosa]|nr:hypothetical protein C8Q76DRAFT_175929 [Earliella scabrosa]